MSEANNIVWALIPDPSLKSELKVQWPAKVVGEEDSEDVPKPVLEMFLKRKETHQNLRMVYLFRLYKYQLLGPNYIKGFTENYKKYCKRFKDIADFNFALEEIKDQTMWPRPDHPMLAYMFHPNFVLKLPEESARQIEENHVPASQNSPPVSNLTARFDGNIDPSTVPASQNSPPVSNTTARCDGNIDPSTVPASQNSLPASNSDGNIDPSIAPAAEEVNIAMQLPLAAEEFNIASIVAEKVDSLVDAPMEQALDNPLLDRQIDHFQQEHQLTYLHHDFDAIANNGYQASITNSSKITDSVEDLFDSWEKAEATKNTLALARALQIDENALPFQSQASPSCVPEFSSISAAPSFPTYPSPDAASTFPNQSTHTPSPSAPLQHFDPDTFVPDKQIMGFVSGIWEKSKFAENKKYENLDMIGRAVYSGTDAPIPGSMMENHPTPVASSSAVITENPEMTFVSPVESAGETAADIIPELCDWQSFLSIAYPSFDMNKLKFENRSKLPHAIKNFLERKGCDLSLSKVKGRFMIPKQFQEEFLVWFAAFEGTNFGNMDVYYPGKVENSVEPVEPALNVSQGHSQMVAGPSSSVQISHVAHLACPAPVSNTPPIKLGISKYGAETADRPSKRDTISEPIVEGNPEDSTAAIDKLVWALNEKHQWWPAKIEDPNAFPRLPEEAPENLEEYLPIFFFGLNSYDWVLKTGIVLDFHSNYNDYAYTQPGNDDFQLGVDECFDKNSWPIREYKFKFTPRKKGRMNGSAKGKGKATKGKSLPANSQENDLLDDTRAASASKPVKKKAPIKRRKSTGSVLQTKKLDDEVLKSVERIYDDDEMTVESVSEESSGDEMLKRKVPTHQGFGEGTKKIKPVTTAAKKASTSASFAPSLIQSLEFPASSRIPKLPGKSYASPSTSTLQPPSILSLSQIGSTKTAAFSAKLSLSDTAEPGKDMTNSQSPIGGCTEEHRIRMEALEYKRAEEDAKRNRLKETLRARKELSDDGVPQEEIDQMFPLSLA